MTTSLARLSLFAALTLVAVSVASTAAADVSPINAVAGDQSWVERHGRPPTEADDARELDRIQTHLAWVERVLRARDVSGLDPERRARRARLLDALTIYRAAGAFPHNERFAGRRPRFIDDEGRICAVGYLIEVDATFPEGGRALAEAIDARFEYDYLLDMDDPRLASWVASSGFTARELAMIQPSYHFQPPEPVRPVEPPPPPPMSASELAVAMIRADAVVRACAEDAGPAIARVTVRHSRRRGLSVSAVTRPRRRAVEACVRRAVEIQIVSAARGAPDRPLATARTYRLRPPADPRAALLFEARSALDGGLAQMQGCMPPPTSARRGDVALRVRVEPDGTLTLVRARFPTLERRGGLGLGGLSDDDMLTCVSSIVSGLHVSAPSEPVEIGHRLPFGGHASVLTAAMLGGSGPGGLR